MLIEAIRAGEKMYLASLDHCDSPRVDLQYSIIHALSVSNPDPQRLHQCQACGEHYAYSVSRPHLCRKCGAVDGRCNVADAPVDGATYRLTSGPGDASIANGDSWADAKVKGDDSE